MRLEVFIHASPILLSLVSYSHTNIFPQPRIIFTHQHFSPASYHAQHHEHSEHSSPIGQRTGHAHHLVDAFASQQRAQVGTSEGGSEVGMEVGVS